MRLTISKDPGSFARQALRVLEDGKGQATPEVYVKRVRKGIARAGLSLNDIGTSEDKLKAARLNVYRRKAEAALTQIRRGLSSVLEFDRAFEAVRENLDAAETGLEPDELSQLDNLRLSEEESAELRRKCVIAEIQKMADSHIRFSRGMGNYWQRMIGQLMRSEKLNPDTLCAEAGFDDQISEVVRLAIRYQ